MTQQEAYKQQAIKMLQEEHIDVLAIEALEEEIQPRDGYKTYQATGVLVLTLLNRNQRAKREEPFVVDGLSEKLEKVGQ